MARPREFDMDVALSRAMDVFWEHGYGDATLPDLLEGMQLTRGSLYKAFHDKKALFLRVLGAYDDQIVSEAVVLLMDEAMDGWARIFKLFASIEESVRAGDLRGCLLCSAIAGPAAFDQDIEAMTTRSLGRMRTAFEQALTADGVSQAAPLADFLVTQYVGLRILARTKGSTAHISKSIAALKTMAEQLNQRAG